MTATVSNSAEMFAEHVPITDRAESTLLAVKAGIDSSVWQLEVVSIDALVELKDQLSELAEKSSDPNIFFHPDFLSASHLRLDETDKKLLILSETLDESKRIVLCLPLIQTRTGFPATPVLKVWSHAYGPLSSPLMDCEDEALVAERFCELVFLSEIHSAKAIVFEDLPSNHVLSKALRSHEIVSRAVKVTHEYERAHLSPELGSGLEAHIFNPKQARELRRQARKLHEYGDVTFEVTSDYETAILRFEEFLLLEAKGWKGRHGTSMHSIKRTASFARQAMSNLVQKDMCYIVSLRVQDKSVASLILLKINNHFFPWKMAFNESFAPLSVGKQLMVMASNHLLAQDGFAGADSLAAEDNLLMNKLWPGRLPLNDLVVGVGHNPIGNAKRVSAAIKRRRRFRTLVKRLVRRLASSKR